VAIVDPPPLKGLDRRYQLRLGSVMQAYRKLTEGLRYREIGQVLQMSLGAVSLSLTRSLARLARAAER